MVLSIIDIKTSNLDKGFIPSVLTTTFMIVMFLLNPGASIVYGLFAGLLSLLFIDLDLFKGVPDVKVFTALGMGFVAFTDLVLFAFIFLSFNLLIQGILKFLIWKGWMKDLKLFPLLPVMFLGYLAYVIFFVIL